MAEAVTVMLLERITNLVDALTQELRTVDPNTLTVADCQAIKALIGELTALVRLAETS